VAEPMDRIMISLGIDIVWEAKISTQLRNQISNPFSDVTIISASWGFGFRLENAGSTVPNLIIACLIF